jgi:hypothetical protein
LRKLRREAASFLTATDKALVLDLLANFRSYLRHLEVY